MAEQDISEEFTLGRAARDCRGRRVVRTHARATWLDVYRSIHRSASLRAIYQQQVSPSRALLFLSYRVSCFGGAVDDISRGRVLCFTPMAVAWTAAARSPAGLRFLLDRRSSCFLFSLLIATGR